MKYKFLIVLFLTAQFGFSQIGGQNTYQFLNLPVNPAQSAMGGKVVTSLSYNPSMGLLNPANINEDMAGQVSANYMNYIADIGYGTASYAHKVNEKYGVLQAGVTYIDYGNFDGFDEFGNETADFGGNEVAVSMGYAYQLPDTRFSFGINIKAITSRLEQYSSFGMASDIGVTYYNPESKWIFSGVLRNAGGQLKAFDEVTESLPLELIFGMSKELEKVPIRWHVTLENMQEWDLAFRNPSRDETDLEGNVTRDDPSFLNNVFRHTVFGVELFPNGGFTVRLGYSFRRAEELRVIDQRSFAGLSGGFQIKFNRFRFSYSYMRFNQAASSSFFGVDIDLK
ncbi:type IX secretion system protein PorQ [Psychroflexus planctonicus]|uniref:Penicillin-binding protein n=1 Tax=Psychroflexus planctonicus TaxID=1526575 RepID=A0ABQ1SHM0_9FLAO|nr:type IX secretion system protein PorQ [Psychroflexus planctonicus]GGE33442.1 penicillin-binding protein [Psychroflexus planctonicus]